MLKTRIRSVVWSYLRRMWCQHPELMRQRIDGVWYFTCTCGFRMPVMKRPPAEQIGRGMWR